MLGAGGQTDAIPHLWSHASLGGGPLPPAGATCYSAWLTHIVDCAGDRLWGFLVAGAVVFPVGIVHGAGVWVGAW